MQVQRTDQRALEFNGDEIAGADGEVSGGKKHNRWHTIQVWRTTAGKFVVQVIYHTRCKGEVDYHDGYALDDVGAVTTLLEQYVFPNLGTIGYPPTPANGVRQARLMADLESSWKRLATDALNQLKVTERAR